MKSENSFVIKNGTGKVMISAPRCVEQLRNGKVKSAERETGILAEMLNTAYGCPVIIKARPLDGDANYDADCNYKKALCEYIKANDVKFLIDLHQLSPERRVMINIGTGNFKNLSDKTQLNIFVSSFTAEKLGMLQIDESFAGAFSNTVSSYVHKNTEIPCVQIEINTRLVCHKYKEYSLDDVYKSLTRCVKYLEKNLGGNK